MKGCHGRLNYPLFSQIYSQSSFIGYLPAGIIMSRLADIILEGPLLSSSWLLQVF